MVPVPFPANAPLPNILPNTGTSLAAYNQTAMWPFKIIRQNHDIRLKCKHLHIRQPFSFLATQRLTIFSGLYLIAFYMRVDGSDLRKDAELINLQV